MTDQVFFVVFFLKNHCKMSKHEDINIVIILYNDP